MIAILLAALAISQDAGSFISPGELAEAHQEYIGLSQCTQCHTLGVGLDLGKCLDCHDPIQKQIDQKKGYHADKSASCATCHPDHRGRGFDMVDLDEDSIDHDETGFPLEGSHQTAECEDCHEQGAWSGVDPVCASCHDDPHGADKSSRALLGECESCHGVVDWDVLPLAVKTFDHTAAADTDYLLAGEHLDVGCEECHEDWTFLPTASDSCRHCHDDIHSGQFSPRSCEDCHTVDVAKFALRDYDHSQTDYPLVGQHRRVRCESCHQDGERARYVDLAHGECKGCHDDPHAGQFEPRDCDACHTLAAAGFEVPDIDHDQTNYPLVGAHREVPCEQCHGLGEEPVFAGLPFDDCSTCHDDVHESRFEPQRCDDCHKDVAWTVTEFDHSQTDYPLTGAHIDAGCAECHDAEGERVLAPIRAETCMDCHAEQDPHLGHFEGEQCTGCHQTDSWALVSFDHLQRTDFALVDGHDLACSECHNDATYTGSEPACESCHEAPAAHFQGECAGCHLPTDWNRATLGEAGHDVTGFPLRGIHDVAECVECHTPGRPAHNASRFCVDCHRSEDPHRNLLGNSCQDCHGPTDWTRTRFRHALTGWPLRGSHRLATCNDCHATGYAGTPQDCWRCHNREKPSDSTHKNSATRDCAGCHRPYDWDTGALPHRSP